MIQNIIAVIVGLVVGGALNMAIVSIGPMIIPPPEGSDLSTLEGLRAAMPRMETKHFLAPFLAHSLGAFFSALIAALIATSHKMAIAIGIGVFTLMGGIAAAVMIPAPIWFIALDLIAAYLPTAWLAGKIATARAN